METTHTSPKVVVNSNNADSSSNFLALKSLSDIYPNQSENRANITRFARLNPNIDYIYTFKLNEEWIGNNFKGSSLGMFAQNRYDSNICIAGSSALWRLCSIINQKNPNWKSQDTDIFLLNSPSNIRFYRAGYNVDLVHSTSKTCQELISKFDLPCCRVAYDFNYTFYVSLQALASIFSGKMYLPEYFENKDAFTNILEQHSTIKDEWKHAGKTWLKHWYQTMSVRLQERIVKYRSRGFAPKYYETDYVLPWIKERFRYSEFETQPDPEVHTNSPPVSKPMSQNQTTYETTQLAKNVAEILSRRAEDVSKHIQMLHIEWDVKTKEDWLLLDEEQALTALSKISSIPIRNALGYIHSQRAQLLKSLSKKYVSI